MGDGEREYTTLSFLPGFWVGKAGASIISTSSPRRLDSSSDELSDEEPDSDSDSEDSDEDDSSKAADFAEICAFSFTAVGLSLSEPEELPSSEEEDEDPEEDATLLFLFLLRFLEGFEVVPAFTALF